jgi:hypothetical protein
MLTVWRDQHSALQYIAGFILSVAPGKFAGLTAPGGPAGHTHLLHQLDVLKCNMLYDKLLCHVAFADACLMATEACCASFLTNATAVKPTSMQVCLLVLCHELQCIAVTGAVVCTTVDCCALRAA